MLAANAVAGCSLDNLFLRRRGGVQTTSKRTPCICMLVQSSSGFLRLRRRIRSGSAQDDSNDGFADKSVSRAAAGTPYREKPKDSFAASACNRCRRSCLAII
jgi:hypothetical protein